METAPNFCKNGHDKNLVGVLNNGYCRECGRISRRKQWADATPEQKNHIRAKMRERYQAGLTQTNVTTPICPSGHVKAKVGITKNGGCRACVREAEKFRRENATPEEREKRRLLDRVRYEKYYNSERRRQQLLADYDLDEATYQQMDAEQNHLCKICKQPETRTRNGKRQMLHVDHDHATGKVRALLCNACNVAIGYMHDDPQLLIAAAEYLFRFQQE